MNTVSPLLAVQSPLPPQSNEQTNACSGVAGVTSGGAGGGSSAFGGFGGIGSSDFSFDTFALQNALTRSQQLAGSSGGLRRAVSAPHSMDLLGMEQAALQQQQQNRPGYLPPTGGPMRRAASSLALRRSSSFFWTPSAHQDFERAISALVARGEEVTAMAIMGEMNHHSPDLKLSDVDKHLRKKALLQRRVLQQLDHGSSGESPAPNGLGGSIGGGLGGGLGAGLRPGFVAPHSSPASMRAGLRVPGAIAEEPAVTSEVLAQQMQAQKMQHMQFSAAREALVTSAVSQAAEQQQQQQQQQQTPSLS